MINQSLTQVLKPVCPTCGTAFNTTYYRKRFCSKRCVFTGTAWRRRKRIYVPHGTKSVYYCEVCKMEIIGSAKDLQNHKFETHGH